MPFSSKTCQPNDFDGYYDASVETHCNSGHSLFRKKTKFLLKCFVIICFMCTFGNVLLFMQKSSHVTPSSVKSVESQQPRNVFELFNRHMIIFRNLNSEEDDYTQSDDVLFRKVSTKSSSRRKNKTSFINFSEFSFNHSPFLPQADCRNVIAGDADTITRTRLLQLEFKGPTYADRRKKLKEFENELVNMTQNCSNFLTKRKYITRPLTTEEAAYPLAYIFAVHKKFSSFEKLLRSIYQPQNIYCVHVDGKADPVFLEEVRNLTKCFTNVFVASNLSEVYYTHWSRVQADINCFKDLVKKKVEVPWKYVINLCALDYPLKTNYEIVRDLKSMHGYNNIESIASPEHKKVRFEYRFVRPTNPSSDYVKVEKTSTKKSPPPLDTPMFAGSAYYVWRREAVEFMLTDSKVQAFFKWNEDTYSPDEHVWATLQRWYPHLPGSAPPHSKYDTNELQTYTRLVKWGGLDTSVYPKCAGTYRRGVCVYGVGDLSWLVQQHHFFANKFDAETDPFAIECLDTWLRNRTITQAKKYNALGFV